MRRALPIIALALVTFAAAAPGAGAGTYEVKACHTPPGGAWIGNASWGAEVPGPFATAYTGCPGEGIVARMSVGVGTAPYGATARQVFTAPPGNRIVHFRGNVDFTEFRGWHAGLVDATPRWIWCGAACTSFTQYWWTEVDVNSSQLFAQVVCGNFSGCPRWHLDGLMAMRDVVVTVEDNNAPGVAITGGSVSQPGWHTGNQDVQYSAWDSSGIQRVDVLVDGYQRGGKGGGCSDATPQPCDNKAGVEPLTGEVFGKDGRHNVTVVATDAVGIQSQTTHAVQVDRTPPAQPLEVAIDETAPWRSRNSFSVSWRNPSQDAAPIRAARLELCPTTGDDRGTQACVERRQTMPDGVTTIRDLQVPSSGGWTLKLWLEDAAGNADPERSVTVGGLRFDDMPPTAAFLPATDGDPTRVHVRASDATSGIGGAQVEARRRGEDAWRALDTRFEKGGFEAVLDDETLPKGTYELRARATDLAGNERSTTTTQDGEPAIRRLPLRVRTRLVVGKPKKVRARGAHGRHRFRTILVVQPQARYGRTIPLRGRLTMPGANPLAGADLEVWSRVDLDGAPWRRISQLRTRRNGRFRFKALRGPSRTLRFRYPGTATIRARSTEVDLRVRAVTSMRVNRKHVVNGEEVRFFGRLRGRQNPNTGKLLQLQVFTRGRWSTFATPRANRASGRWSYAYRFTGTRGHVDYRFRALIPREASFPYDTGVSHSVHVMVRGL